MRIRKLDEQTIDQIAAGEVIDGPYSCVKELIDNAIDSQATHITIDIALGGQELIRVQDNGIGIAPDELHLAVERHATSKISSVSDLDSLDTMGFRGEALSSIASISQLSILSCPRGDDTDYSDIGSGSKIALNGGKEISFQNEIKALFGTCIEVRHLFYNLPARRKFMKSPKEDARLVYKTVSQLALAHPEISFELLFDGAVKASFTKGQGDQKERIRHRVEEIFGKEIASEGIFFQKTLSDRLIMQGFLGFPQIAKSSRSAQSLIVNSRPIQSLAISYAVKNGYATSIGKDEHPVYALFIDIDPEDIDINVHPQKKEIRFRDEESLKMMIEEIVSSLLFSPMGEEHKELIKPSFSPPIAQLYEAPAVAFSTIRPSSVHLSFKNPPSLFEAPTATPPPIKACREMPIQSEEAYTVSLFPLSNNFPAAFIFFQRKATTILNLQSACKAIYILHYLEQSTRTNSESEALFIPQFIRLEKSESSQFEAIIPELEREGFTIRLFGFDSFMVEAVPKDMLFFSKKIDLDHFFTERLRESNQKNALDHRATQEATIGGTVYSKEELTLAFQKSSRLVHSLQMFQKGQKVSLDFATYIAQEWANRGFPPVSLSGEIIAIGLDDPFLTSLFL